MLASSLDIVSGLIAVLLALFAAAAVAYQARISKGPYDSAGNRFIGVLLGLSLLVLIVSVFKLPFSGDENWIPWVLFGFGAIFAWLIRPRR